MGHQCLVLLPKLFRHRGQAVGLGLAPPEQNPAQTPEQPALTVLRIIRRTGRLTRCASLDRMA